MWTRHVTAPLLFNWFNVTVMIVFFNTWICCTGFFFQQHLLSLMTLLLISLVSSLEEPLWLSYLQRKLGRGLLGHPLQPSYLHSWWAQFQFVNENYWKGLFFFRGVDWWDLLLNRTHSWYFLFAIVNWI